MVMEWSPVLGTVEEFVDYALFFVGVAIVYYVVRLMMSASPSKEDRAARDAEWSERGAETRKHIGERWTKFKTEAESKEAAERKKKEKKKIQALASPLVDKIYIQVYPLLNVIKTHLIKKERAPALANLKKLKGEIHLLWRQLHSLRHAVSDVKKDEINNLMIEVDALVHLVETKCINKVPKKVDGNWSDTNDSIKAIIAELDGQVKSDLGNFYTKIKSLYS